MKKNVRVLTVGMLATAGLLAAACAPTPGGGGATNLLPVATVTATPVAGDIPLLVTFSSAGSIDPDGTITTYSWDFGDGSALASTVDTAHLYTSVGTFTARLSLTDNSGGISSTTVVISTSPANLAPTAGAAAAPTAGKAPLSVEFSSASSSDSDGTIASYSWAFGDGGSSNVANPSYTYTTAGTFTATLTVTDNDGLTDSADLSVQVSANIAPTAVANSNVTAGQVPLTVLFSSLGSTDPDGGITAYSWDFGDGNSSTSANPSYTFGSLGTFPVTLTVSDLEGATSVASLAIQVDPTPNLAPTAVAAASPTTIRQGLAVSFSSAGSTDADGTITAYHWDFGDGVTSTTANPTHAYAVAGPKTATLTVTDNAGGTGTSSQVITVVSNLAPTAAASGSPSGGKQPVTVSFSSTGSNDSDGSLAAYNWDFGDGSADKTTPSATHTYTNAGIFIAQLTVTDDFGATDTATVTTVVIANQAPTAVLSATPQSGARPLVVAFSAASSSDPDGSITSYNWEFGDGGLSSAISPSHTYAAGNYTATLTVTDDNGVVSAQQTVAISVVIDDDADGVSPPSDCNDTNAGINPSAPDPLDAAGLDSNCDGADGQLSQTVFVAAIGGADWAGCGALASPCASIQQGVSTAIESAKSVVQVASGTYPAGFTLSNAVTVTGGYSAGFGSKSASSTVNGAVLATSTTSGASIVDLSINGAGGSNATGVLVQSGTLTLLRVAVNSGTPTGAGSSAYGVRALSSSNVSVVDSVLSSQAGIAANPGSGVPTAAAGGCNGGNGANASGPSSPGGTTGSCGGSGVASSGTGGRGGEYSGGGASGGSGGGGAAGGNGGCGSLFGCGTNAGNGSGGAAGSGGGAGSGATNSAGSAAALWVGLSGGFGSGGSLGGGGGGGGGGGCGCGCGGCGGCSGLVNVGIP